jgi:Uma2 family endonuclease
MPSSTFLSFSHLTQIAIMELKSIGAKKAVIAINPVETDLSRKALGAENRVLLRDIAWNVYEIILNARGECRSPRLSYYQGQLELMAPLEEHESASNLIDQFINILTEEKEIDLKSLASTTLNRPDLNAGAEPDQCYYVKNEHLVRGKIVDLKTDPPPDLVIEVDITHTDINKNALYQDLGVSEFWRFNGKSLTIYALQEGQYQEVEASSTFPWMTKEMLYQFLKNAQQQGETSAKRTFRHWLRG